MADVKLKMKIENEEDVDRLKKKLEQIRTCLKEIESLKKKAFSDSKYKGAPDPERRKITVSDMIDAKNVHVPKYDQRVLLYFEDYEPHFVIGRRNLFCELYDIESSDPECVQRREADAWLPLGNLGG